MLLALLLAIGIGDKSNCKCGDTCKCADGRVALYCSCPKGGCRCADVGSLAPALYGADAGLNAGLGAMMTTPLQGSTRTVVMADAMRFGIGFHEVRYQWNLSREHAARMRDTVRANDTTMLPMWEVECEFRARAFYLLDDVINCPQMSLQNKLASLEALRVLIGDEMFFRGEIPRSTPSYRMPNN